MKIHIPKRIMVARWFISFSEWCNILGEETCSFFKGVTGSHFPCPGLAKLTATAKVRFFFDWLRKGKGFDVWLVRNVWLVGCSIFGREVLVLGFVSNIMLGVYDVCLSCFLHPSSWYVCFIRISRTQRETRQVVTFYEQTRYTKHVLSM